MAYEIDINKLHGDIKRYAQMALRGSSDLKGNNKLDTMQEINLFKEMIIRNGKQDELLRQLPNFKGLDSSKKNEKEVNKQILKTMKNGSIEDTQKAVQEKLSAK